MTTANKLETLTHFINGKRVAVAAGARTQPVFNPATGTPCAQVVLAVSRQSFLAQLPGQSAIWPSG